jgi:hypothetical protein
MNTEEKQEASIPVQSRINIVDLAELANLWESKGMYIKTMSQLVSWSISLLCQELRSSENMPIKVDGVAEANSQLAQRGLYQQSLKGRSLRKIGMALGFENLRREGKDPRGYAPVSYKSLHQQNQVEPMPEGMPIGFGGKHAPRWLPLPGFEGIYYPEGDEDQKDKLIKQQQAAMEVEKKRQLKIKVDSLKASGELGYSDTESANKGPDCWEGMTLAEANAKQAKIDAEIRARENSPDTIEFLRKNAVKGDGK